LTLDSSPPIQSLLLPETETWWTPALLFGPGRWQSHCCSKAAVTSWIYLASGCQHKMLGCISEYQLLPYSVHSRQAEACGVSLKWALPNNPHVSFGSWWELIEHKSTVCFFSFHSFFAQGYLPTQLSAVEVPRNMSPTWSKFGRIWEINNNPYFSMIFPLFKVSSLLPHTCSTRTLPQEQLWWAHLESLIELLLRDTYTDTIMKHQGGEIKTSFHTKEE
jgi:hypothetical protein